MLLSARRINNGHTTTKLAYHTPSGPLPAAAAATDRLRDAYLQRTLASPLLPTAKTVNECS